MYLEFAKNHVPEINITRIQIQKAENQKSLERKKIIDNVSFGISYTRGADGGHFIGPGIGLDLPVFDWNSAQIERARKQQQKAKEKLLGIESVIETKINQIKNTITSHAKKIKDYEKIIIPAAKKATEYALKHASSMELDSITLINSQLALYQQELNLNREYLELLHSLATLEKTIGGSIPQRNIPYK